MTEEEAKTKWCPMLQVSGAMNSRNATLSTNRLDGADYHKRVMLDYTKDAMCIASDCMAWRWIHIDNTGYCGLASKP